MKRFAGLLAVPVALASVNGLVAPRGVSAQKPAKVCAASARKFAKLSAPTSLSAAIVSVRANLFLRTPLVDDIDPKVFDRETAYDRHVDGFNDAIGDLVDALGVGATSHAPRGPAAVSAIAKAQFDLTGIDETRAKAKVPAACSSQAFGAGYFAQVAAVIKAAVPGLTGDFTTDGNAACARLDSKVGDAKDHESQPADYVELLDQAFTSFQLDLQAMKPPAASPTQFASLQGIVRRAVHRLDQLTISVGHEPRSRLKHLAQTLSPLGDELNAATTALALHC